MENNMTQGSVAEFSANWQRPEADYCHWTRGEPQNQIQFAFRQNWLFFQEILEPLKPWAAKRCLEVGAGRGTMSLYFADAGWNCTLVDAVSEPLAIARRTFEKVRLACHTYEMDALGMDFVDNQFDCVFSYGLLEHFDDIEKPIAEQVRVLKPGGMLIAYVVPGEPNWCNPQWQLFNRIIGHYAGVEEKAKHDVHRNKLGYVTYCKAMWKSGLKEMCGSEVYPFPMISPSPEFPFSLNPDPIEREIVKVFESDPDGWCRHPFFDTIGSQAFVISGRKP